MLSLNPQPSTLGVGRSCSRVIAGCGSGRGERRHHLHRAWSAAEECAPGAADCGRGRCSVHRIPGGHEQDGGGKISVDTSRWQR